MRSYEMTEIGKRGLDACLDEAFEIALDECDAVFLSVDIDVCDPGHAPGTGTPEPGGLSAGSCSTPYAGSAASCRSPASTWSRCRRPTTTPRSPRSSPTGSAWRRSPGWRPRRSASPTTPPGRSSRVDEHPVSGRPPSSTATGYRAPPTSWSRAAGSPRSVSGPRSGDEVVDLDGGLLAPGFTDAHVHPIQGGLERLRCDLSELSTREEYLAAVRAYADAHPDREWILGGGWAMPAFPGGTPLAADLDAVVPDRPVFLPNRDHHGAWVNTRALEIAGIDRRHPGPAGRPDRARRRRPPDGHAPRGRDRAGQPAPAARPRATDYRAALLAGQAYLHSLGVTGWQDAIVGSYSGMDDPASTYLDAAAERRADARTSSARCGGSAAGGRAGRGPGRPARGADRRAGSGPPR